MRLGDMMSVIVSFVITALIVMGSIFLYTLLPPLVGGFVLSALWVLMLWSVYEDYNNDDPFD